MHESLYTKLEHRQGASAPNAITKNLNLNTQCRNVLLALATQAPTETPKKSPIVFASRSTNLATVLSKKFGKPSTNQTLFFGRNLPVYTTIFQYIPLYTIIYHYIPLYTTIYQYIQLYTNIYHYIPLYTIIYYYIQLYTTIYNYIPLYYIPLYTTMYHYTPLTIY